MIVAEPTDFAVTVQVFPFELMEATEELLVLHVTFWFVAVLGSTVAVSVFVSPTFRLADVAVIETPVTGEDVTVTLQVAV